MIIKRYFAPAPSGVYSPEPPDGCPWDAAAPSRQLGAGQTHAGRGL